MEWQVDSRGQRLVGYIAQNLLNKNVTLLAD